MGVLEQVTDYLGSINAAAIQRNFDTLEASGISTGNQQLEIRTGGGTWTWPGGQQSSSVATVSHGLGRAPVLVLVQNNTDQGPNEVIGGYAFGYTSTSFGTRGSSKVHTNYAAGTTGTFVWLAIG